MKNLISALAIATTILGAGACTVGDDSPDVDVSTLDLRSDYEVIIVQLPHHPRLAAGDLPANAGAAGLSFADDHYVGGASSAAGAIERAPVTPTFPGHEFDPRWTQEVNPLAIDTTEHPTFPGHELEQNAGAWRGYEIEPFDHPTYEGHELSSATTNLPADLDDPCMCTGQDCLNTWVDTNIGCNVCAVFVCDGSTPHACVSCQ